jgi:chromosome segregation ATPase
MTGEEMERAIEFLLKNQASFESGLVELKEQISETNKQLLMHAETQTELIQIVTRNAEDQRRFNAEFRVALRELAAAQARTDESLRNLSASQEHTDDSLRNLSAAQARTDGQLNQTNEQLKRTDGSLRNLAEAQARTDERLNRTGDNLDSLAETVRRFVEGRS